MCLCANVCFVLCAGEGTMSAKDVTNREKQICRSGRAIFKKYLTAAAQPLSNTNHANTNEPSSVSVSATAEVSSSMSSGSSSSLSQAQLPPSTTTTGSTTNQTPNPNSVTSPSVSVSNLNISPSSRESSSMSGSEVLGGSENKATGDMVSKQPGAQYWSCTCGHWAGRGLLCGHCQLPRPALNVVLCTSGLSFKRHLLADVSRALTAFEDAAKGKTQPKSMSNSLMEKLSNMNNSEPSLLTLFQEVQLWAEVCLMPSFDLFLSMVRLSCIPKQKTL